MPLAGKTPVPRAIQDHRVPQGLKERKVSKELPGRRARLGPRVRRGRKVLLETKERKVRKERKATREIRAILGKETGATKGIRATPVTRFVLSRLTGR